MGGEYPWDLDSEDSASILGSNQEGQETRVPLNTIISSGVVGLTACREGSGDYLATAAVHVIEGCQKLATGFNST